MRDLPRIFVAPRRGANGEAVNLYVFGRPAGYLKRDKGARRTYIWGADTQEQADWYDRFSGWALEPNLIWNGERAYHNSLDKLMARLANRLAQLDEPQETEK